ncbi:cytochrome b5 domain-containing protein [Candidatus Nomurabacteria bacterium]|nr:cytochrome b5 domain-containing protein [Candidatus Nomurabacteria bacterium]
MNKKILVGAIILVIVLIIGGFLLTKVSNVNPVVLDNNTSVVNKTLANYSLSDVGLHKKATDCWIAISGKVYDATDFIASGQHNEKILNGCGIDATDIYSQVEKHQSSKAQGLLASMQIGVLK